MARKSIPISITKQKRKRKILYLSSSSEKKDEIYDEVFEIEINQKPSNWNLVFRSDKRNLIDFRNQINRELGFSDIVNIFECSIEEAEQIDSYHETNDVCSSCIHKNSACYECIFTCQSPLERILFLALRDKSIMPELQKRINRNGKVYSKNFPVIKSEILTIPDFYIESNNKRLCIYADGHTYHERTESQALRDRSIDRELQGLGYAVLRFTGKEIRENIQKVVIDIEKHLK